MTWFDYAVLGVIGVSVLFGAFRGLVRELVALAGWIAAFVLAATFTHSVAPLLPQTLGPAGTQVAAFIGILVMVWLAAGILGWLLSRVVKAAGLGMPDRLLGALFGMARGVLVVLVGVLLAGLTVLPREAVWREALLSGPLETAVIALKPMLPAGLAQRVRYR